jgi:hypothetical protein
MNDREKALEAALRDIARQRKTDEMPREDRRNGDFEGACDTMIDVARAALAMPATVDRAGWEASIRSAAIREFCQNAGIKPSIEVIGLPADVKQWRLERAVSERFAPPPEDAP